MITAKEIDKNNNKQSDLATHYNNNNMTTVT